MSMHRKNKSRNQTRTGIVKGREVDIDAQWFKNSVQRRRRRAKMGKKSRQINRRKR